MDLARKIIAQEQHSAHDRLIADSRARERSMRALTSGGRLGSPAGRRLTENLAVVRTPKDIIRQVIRDEEYVEAGIEKRKPRLRSRVWSWIKRHWYRPPENHTHRIIARAELKQYDKMPNSIDDLMEFDEDNKPIKFPKWKKITVERGLTGKLCKVLFVGALVLELADGSYVIAGWEHVSKL